jgi:hypothetical protein
MKSSHEQRNTAVYRWRKEDITVNLNRARWKSPSWWFVGGELPRTVVTSR